MAGSLAMRVMRCKCSSVGAIWSQLTRWYVLPFSGWLKGILRGEGKRITGAEQEWGCAVKGTTLQSRSSWVNGAAASRRHKTQDRRSGVVRVSHSVWERSGKRQSEDVHLTVPVRASLRCLHGTGHRSLHQHLAWLICTSTVGLLGHLHAHRRLTPKRT